MDKRAATALEASIEHWERMAKFRDVRQFNNESPYSDFCRLCLEFDDCAGCPVENNTGHTHCRNTPWQSAALRQGDLIKVETPRDWKPWRKAAQAEIDFLKSLRDD